MRGVGLGFILGGGDLLCLKERFYSGATIAMVLFCGNSPQP